MVLQHASRKLDKTPESVEAFVEHLVFLHRMGNEISALEREYNIVTRMYSIARNFDVPITAEELALYQTPYAKFSASQGIWLYEYHNKFTKQLCLARKRRKGRFMRYNIFPQLLHETDLGHVLAQLSAHDTMRTYTILPVCHMVDLGENFKENCTPNVL